nr:MAG TPA: hypothetical protein [Bacteriophage sp.]
MCLFSCKTTHYFLHSLVGIPEIKQYLVQLLNPYTLCS